MARADRIIQMQQTTRYHSILYRQQAHQRCKRPRSVVSRKRVSEQTRGNSGAFSHPACDLTMYQESNRRQLPVRRIVHRDPDE